MLFGFYAITILPCITFSLFNIVPFKFDIVAYHLYFFIKSAKFAEIKIAIIKEKVVDTKKDLNKAEIQAFEVQGEFRVEGVHRCTIKEYHSFNNKTR